MERKARQAYEIPFCAYALAGNGYWPGKTGSSTPGTAFSHSRENGKNPGRETAAVLWLWESDDSQGSRLRHPRKIVKELYLIPVLFQDVGLQPLPGLESEYSHRVRGQLMGEAGAAVVDGDRLGRDLGWLGN